MIKNKTVLVTGGAGFIGSHVSNFLSSKGYKVVVLDNLASGDKKKLKPGITFVKADILNKDKLSIIFSRFRPETVIHLAALTSKNPKIGKQVINVNVEGTKNVTELSSKFGVKNFIFASSAAVYNPVNLYGKSKAMAEKLVKTLSQYVILRMSNVYGPGQRSDNEGGVVSIFLKAVKKNEPLLVNGNGKQTRDFIYIDDVVIAYFNALKLQKKQILNISTNVKTSILDLVKVIGKASKIRPQVKMRKLTQQEIKNSKLNSLKAVKVLSWQPKTDLIKGIKKTYKYENN